MNIEYEAFCGVDGECELGFSTRDMAESWLALKLIALDASEEQVKNSYILESVPVSVGTFRDGVFGFEAVRRG